FTSAAGARARRRCATASCASASTAAAFSASRRAASRRRSSTSALRKSFTGSSKSSGRTKLLQTIPRREGQPVVDRFGPRIICESFVLLELSDLPVNLSWVALREHAPRAGGEAPRHRRQLLAADELAGAEACRQPRAHRRHQRRAAGGEHAIDVAGRDAGGGERLAEHVV